MGQRAAGQGDALVHDERRARRPDAAKLPLRRLRLGRVLLGLCGGMADFVGASRRSVRLLFALVTLLTLGVGAAVYLVLCLIVPVERPGTAPA